MAFNISELVFLIYIVFFLSGKSIQNELCQAIPSTNTIDMTSHNLTSVSAASFIYSNDTGTVLAIDLSYNEITHIDADGFRGFYHLQMLNLSHNRISYINNGTFRTLHTLECLDLGFNNFTNLLAGPYNLVNLKWINFEHNSIEFVEPGVVNDRNVYLVHFDLSYNKLKTFEPWPYLCHNSHREMYDRYFDLTNNSIEHFTNDMKWVNNLSPPFEIHVLLQYNNIQNLTVHDVAQYRPGIDNELFFFYLSTFRVNVTHNPFYCDCNLFNLANEVRQSLLRWARIEEYRYRCEEPIEFAGKDWLHDLPLYNMVCDRTDKCPANCTCQDRPHNDTLHIDCTGAGLNEFPDVIPETERTKIEMFLGDNEIRTLKNTSYLHKLYNLTIPNNNIQSLDVSLLKMMHTLTFLDVRKNQIRLIPSHIQTFKYDDVKLSENPLYCDCDSYWLSDWTSNTDTSQSLTCDSETGVHALEDVNLHNLGCTQETFIILGVSLGAVMVVMAVVGLFVYRCPYETKVMLQRVFRVHPWDRYRVDNEDSKIVDIYLVMDCDREVLSWVKKLLRKLRQKKPYYKIMNPYRYTEPGAEETFIRKWIGRSKRVLVILSPGIFENEWRKYEIDVAEDNLIQAMSENRSSNAVEQRDLDNVSRHADTYDNVRVAAKIIYVICGGASREKLGEDPWKRRLLGKTVLDPDRRLFMSKLRYELPSEGNGTAYDENFRVAHGKTLSRRMRERTSAAEEEEQHLLKDQQVPAVSALMEAILKGVADNSNKQHANGNSFTDRRVNQKHVFEISVQDEDVRLEHATVGREEITENIEMKILS